MDQKTIRRQTFTMVCIVAAFVAGEFGIVILDWVIERNAAPVEQTTGALDQPHVSSLPAASSRQTRSAN